VPDAGLGLHRFLKAHSADELHEEWCEWRHRGFVWLINPWGPVHSAGSAVKKCRVYYQGLLEVS
jgi:hypothetical protein